MDSGEFLRRGVALDARASLLEARWRKLSTAYLPHLPPESFWRYADVPRRGQPAAGWKLHVSATVLNANAILSRIAPALMRRGVLFKAPHSLLEVAKLNSGLCYEYSQIGKIFTVYPRNEDEAVAIAHELHYLTRRFSGPSIPFDLRLTQTSNIYYRYGAFHRIKITSGGRETHAMHSPSGELLTDDRLQPKPEWISDPFEKNRPGDSEKKNKSNERIRVLRALAQRGKGGVYEAIDLSGGFPELCLLKEGRKNGEVTWDGRDGAWRIRNEERVLAQLLAAGVNVPAVRSSFQLGGNYYLVMEYLHGETVHNFLARFRRRLPISRVVRYSRELALLFSQMHRAGWVWRDCKPKNLIVTRQDHLIPIDFEGAARINQPDHLAWGTRGFTPPESRNQRSPSAKSDDLYALGAMIYLLLTGRIFEPSRPIAIERFRRGVPTELQRLTHSLLADQRRKRPSAESAYASLNSILLNLRKTPKQALGAKAA